MKYKLGLWIWPVLLGSGLARGAIAVNRIPTPPPEGYSFASAPLAGAEAVQIAHYDPEVMEALNREIRQNPNNAKAYHQRGLLWIHVEDYQKAAADFSAEIRINPNAAEGYNFRGTALFWLEQFDAALADYNQALKLNPELTLAYFNRGYIFRHRGEIERAIADFRQGANLAQQQGEADQAQQALAIIQELESVTTLNQQQLRERGLQKIDEGDYLGAIADFNYLLARRPEALEIYCYRGMAKIALGNYDSAIADFDQALDLDPHYAEAYNKRGNALADLDRPQAALEDFNRAIEYNPDLAEAYYNRGRIYSRLDRPEAARQDYTQAIALDNTLADAYYQRGFSRYEQNEIAEAIADLQQAADLFQAQNNLLRYRQTLSYLNMIQRQQK